MASLSRPFQTTAAQSLFMVVALAFAAHAQGKLEKVAVNLHNNWFVQSSAKVTDTGAVISAPGYSHAGWLQTNIPATPLGAEFDNNLVPSPYVDENAAQIAGTCYDVTTNYANVAWCNGSPYGPTPWWFLNQFTLPSTLAGQRIYLHFDGINYRANLWVNGTQIASNTQMVGTYVRYEYDITNVAVIGGNNAVALQITGPNGGNQELAITYVDWQLMAPDRNEGVWRDAWITNSGAVNVRDPQVQYTVASDLSSAALTVTAELSNPTSVSVSGTLSGTITPGNITFSQPVTLAARASHQLFTFTPASNSQLNIASPRLWWPAKLGPQNLYQATVQFSIAGALSDSQSFNFGIRKLDTGLGPVDPSGNQWRWFKINNQPFVIKGGGWAYDMLLKYDFDPVQLQEQLQYALDMGLNTMRFEGKMEDQTYYDLADQYGILLMSGWCCCTSWEQWKNWSTESQTVANSSLDTQMRELRNHPSAFLWLNSSDLLPPAANEQQEVNVEKADNWPNIVVDMANYGTSTVTGLNGIREGGPYEWEPPNYFYNNTTQGLARGFVDEASVGPMIPPMESMIAGLIENPINYPEDSTWDYHMGGTPFSSLTVFNSAMNSRYGTPTDRNDYMRKAMVMDYEGWRVQHEAYEINKTGTNGRTGDASVGMIDWMFNKGWFSLHWQLFDWFYRPGPAYFATKKADEVTHIAWDYGGLNGGPGTVYVTNDDYTTHTGLTATVDVLNFNLTNMYHSTTGVTAGAASSTRVVTLPTIANLSTTYFINLKLTDSSNNVVSQNFYWYSTTPDAVRNSCKWYFCAASKSANLTSLATLPGVTVAHTDTIGATSVNTTLTNSSSSLAFLIRARVLDSAGNEVLPVWWSDNYITLLPGQSRNLIATYFNNAAPPSGATVHLDGFNVNAN
ncbi:MAG: glycosyl hydrolase 2 galactose-binding domain-containing protein [Candidatus Sulfotelmatobacter sp.]|jgi:exo-1,4-beta-D-glucosaminidase